MIASTGEPTARTGRSNRTGRRPGGSGTRTDILEAARKLFASRGYSGATIRAIAQEAQVDSALIHHFFASKEGVFAAAIEETFAPAEMLPPVLNAGLDGMGERLVRTFLGKWEDPRSAPQLLAVLRSAVSNEEAAQLLRNFLAQELLGRIVRSLDSDDAEVRAALIGAQLVGVAFLRYVLVSGPLANMDTEVLIGMLSPTIQRYLTEPLGPPGAPERAPVKRAAAGRKAAPKKAEPVEGDAPRGRRTAATRSAVNGASGDAPAADVASATIPSAAGSVNGAAGKVKPAGRASRVRSANPPKQ